MLFLWIHIKPTMSSTTTASQRYLAPSAGAPTTYFLQLQLVTTSLQLVTSSPQLVTTSLQLPASPTPLTSKLPPQLMPPPALQKAPAPATD